MGNAVMNKRVWVIERKELAPDGSVRYLARHAKNGEVVANIEFAVQCATRDSARDEAKFWLGDLAKHFRVEEHIITDRGASCKVMRGWRKYWSKVLCFFDDLMIR